MCALLPLKLNEMMKGTVHLNRNGHLLALMSIERVTPKTKTSFTLSSRSKLVTKLLVNTKGGILKNVGNRQPLTFIVGPKITMEVSILPLCSTEETQAGWEDE